MRDLGHTGYAPAPLYMAGGMPPRRTTAEGIWWMRVQGRVLDSPSTEWGPGVGSDARPPLSTYEQGRQARSARVSSPTVALLILMPRRKANNGDEPHPFTEHLVGLLAPTVSLPWTTYADMHDELGPAANLSLAGLAARHTLVVYFFPSEDEGDGPVADTMSRVYRANDGAITQLGGRTVGVSTQTALEQQKIAGNESFPQMMLADHELKLADSLDLPTVEIEGRDEYEALSIVIRDGTIAYVVYPIASPSGHIDSVLCWLTQNQRK
jgi:peroxiredoxin